MDTAAAVPDQPTISRWAKRASFSALSATESCKTSSFDSAGFADRQRAANEKSVELRLMHAMGTLVVEDDQDDPPADGDNEHAEREVAETARSDSPPAEDPQCPPRNYTSQPPPSVTPPAPPARWPQRPLLLRPCPDGGTRIRGVRISSDPPCNDGGFSVASDLCPAALPMNTGLEPNGRCLVIDFESDLFEGTAMLRIRGVAPHPSSKPEGCDERNYFSGRKRTFAAVVRGRFRSPSVPMGRCVTGQIFRRRAGRMPPKIVVNGAVKIISRLAPQLRVDFEGRGGYGGGGGPCFLSPLVSTAQTVVVDSAVRGKEGQEEGGTEVDAREIRKRNTAVCYWAGESLEDDLEEPDPSVPRSAHRALLEATGKPLPKQPSPTKQRLGSLNSSHNATVRSRMKSRKRAYDRLFSASSPPSSPGPCFDVNKVYTFEFFQHLLVFDEFAVDLGSVVGRHGLTRVLNGQPLKFMAALLRKEAEEGGVHGDGDDDDDKTKGGQEKLADSATLEYLWNFDIWHECLYEDATRAEHSKCSQ